jgi:ATP-dependent Clp protease ATP-binding subunit ClpC
MAYFPRLTLIAAGLAIFIPTFVVASKSCLATVKANATPVSLIYEHSEEHVNKITSDTGSVKIAMFERFTDKAIKVIMLAQEESRRLGHNYVGTEHILLGLIAEDTEVAGKVLKSQGINLENAWIEVEKIIGRGDGFVSVEMPFTPGAKRALELSLEQARELGHDYIGTEHLLLGLVKEKEDVGAKALENLGVDLSVIKLQVIKMLQTTPKVSTSSTFFS